MAQSGLYTLTIRGCHSRLVDVVELRAPVRRNDAIERGELTNPVIEAFASLPSDPRVQPVYTVVHEHLFD